MKKVLFIFEVTEKEYYLKMIQMNLLEYKIKNTHNFVKAIYKAHRKNPYSF